LFGRGHFGVGEAFFLNFVLVGRLFFNCDQIIHAKLYVFVDLVLLVGDSTEVFKGTCRSLLRHLHRYHHFFYAITLSFYAIIEFTIAVLVCNVFVFSISAGIMSSPFVFTIFSVSDTLAVIGGLGLFLLVIHNCLAWW
jgi:hypothetical protein